MISCRRIGLGLALLIASHGQLNAQGLRWSYQTRITQSYDSAPGQKAAAPAFEFVPYPNYPFEMVRAHIEGSAQIQFRVTADGRVEDIRVLNATQKEFSDPAIAAVKTWRFLPLSKNGPNFPSSIVVVCSFKFEIPEE